MQKKHKVIHIITRMDKGGSAENTLLTVLGMDKKEFPVTLAKGPSHESRMSQKEQASVSSELKEAQSRGVKLVDIRTLLRRLNPACDLLSLFTIYLYLIKEKPAILHTHTSKAGLLGRLAAKLAGIPVVVHTPHGHVFFGYFGPLKTRMFIMLERLASRITDRIVALTDREKEDYILFKIANADKLVVINSGIELGKFEEIPFNEKQDLKSELGIPDNSLVVGTVGRLVPVKGPEFLIEAARYIHSKHHNTSFVFTGDGPLKQDLEQKARKLGIEKNILFLGWRDDVARIICIYDIFCLPSLNEGMGRVLVEAMALGKPIVASDIGGIPDLVVHGKNGFLVPPKNSLQLARHIQILIEDKEKREKMGQAGKEMALNFSKEIMVEKISNLYKELMTQKKIRFSL
jgi:glycosyltransferase involved in cell wall biosynthesis